MSRDLGKHADAILACHAAARTASVAHKMIGRGTHHQMGTESLPMRENASAEAAVRETLLRRKRESTTQYLIIDV